MTPGRKPRPRPKVERVVDQIKITADGKITYPPELAVKSVTVWDKYEERKVAGSAAPKLGSLEVYLSANPHMEIYSGQTRSGHGEHHVTLWNRATLKKISGRSAPLEKNLQVYLKAHPHCEVYQGQDKQLPPSVLPKRITLYNTRTSELLTGNARPYEDDLMEYLQSRPYMRIALPSDYRSLKMRQGHEQMNKSHFESDAKATCIDGDSQIGELVDSTGVGRAAEVSRMTAARVLDKLIDRTMTHDYAAFPGHSACDASAGLEQSKDLVRNGARRQKQKNFVVFEKKFIEESEEFCRELKLEVGNAPHGESTSSSRKTEQGDEEGAGSVSFPDWRNWLRVA